MRISVKLSDLVASRINPRRVKPERDAHRRLVASIRAYGLIEPLVVRRAEGESHQVIAGNRRLAALRVVHRGSDPEIACELREADAVTARALSLTENFAREGLHPLDEAEAFARLARVDAKGVNAIAAEFGVTERYVRQRSRLADLAEPVKAAYRAGTIDTGTAEAFSGITKERQVSVWEELGGEPRDAREVRCLINHQWIDADHALFDLDRLPVNAVSRDLFAERVLIERSAFFDAQREAVVDIQQGLLEDGWETVLIADRDEVRQEMWTMREAPQEFDAATTERLDEIERRRTQLEAELSAFDETDEVGIDGHYAKLEAVDAKEDQLRANADPHFSHETMAAGTVFLIIERDGRVGRTYRVPRDTASNGATSNGRGSKRSTRKCPVTSDEINDRQRSVINAHKVSQVRAAVLERPDVRRRLLVMALCQSRLFDGLTIRHKSGGIDAYIDNQGEAFESGSHAVVTDVTAKAMAAAKLDDLDDLEVATMYQQLKTLDDGVIADLLEVLVMNCITAHPVASSTLVEFLFDELNLDLRQEWIPDAAWLSGYKKIQLAHLVGELVGKDAETLALKRKKSEVVENAESLFRQSETRDTATAERAKAWIPSPAG